MRGSVYNSRIPSPSYLRTFLTFFVLCSALPVHTQDLASLEDKFAEKIISVTGPGALAVEVVNRSSLSTSEVQSVQQGLLKGLASFGARFVEQGQAAATVRVSLSEDLRNYVWIAEIKQAANESSVAIISAPRLKFSVSPLEGAAMTIRKDLLWSSEDRILDVAEISGGHLLVLYPEQVTLYGSQSGKWQAEQPLAVKHSQPWPRDLRGRLVLRKDHLFDAYLPGVFCRSMGSAILGMNCQQSDDPWPIGSEQWPLSGFFTPARNYFTGALSPGVGKQRSAPAFYSAAWIPRDQYALWLFAGVDENVHFLDGTGEQSLSLRWGSEVATIHSPCGSEWQVVATDSDDSVRAFEIADREPVPATQAIALDGGVSALWTAAEGSSIIAVSQRQDSGVYEAFRLTIACGR